MCRVAIENGFVRIQTAVASDNALTSLLERARDEWTAADKIAVALLAHPSASGDAADVQYENEFDAHIAAAVDRLHAISDTVERAVGADHRAADHASERALWICGVAVALSLLLILAGILVISRVMLRNVHRLVEGARRFADGDRKHRIEIGVPPELREVATEFNRMIGKIDEIEETLAAQARRDPLTGLDNRRAFDEAMEAALARMRRLGEGYVVAAIDVDHFKKVNDTYGHGAGDDVLRGIGATLKSSIREIDRAFRIGGEEFIVLLADVDTPGALIAAERLRTAIANQRIATSGTELQVTASFGLAKATQTTTTAQLLHSADTALYAAKQAGRNRVETA